MRVATVVGESWLYFSWTHFNPAKDINTVINFNTRYFSKPQTLTYTFTAASSNGKEAFQLSVDSWVGRGRIESHCRMSRMSWDDLRTIRGRKRRAYSPLEVDKWGSHCVSAIHQRAESWYWRIQVRPHHCVRRRCVRTIWPVYDMTTSRWRDGQRIPGSTYKTGSSSWRNTTREMENLHVCCWVATAQQVAASGVGIGSAPCQSSGHPGGELQPCRPNCRSGPAAAD